MQAASSAWQLNRGYSMNVHDLNEAAVIIFMKVKYIALFHISIQAHNDRPATSNHSSMLLFSPWPRSRPSKPSKSSRLKRDVECSSSPSRSWSRCASAQVSLLWACGALRRSHGTRGTISVSIAVHSQSSYVSGMSSQIWRLSQWHS